MQECRSVPLSWVQHAHSGRPPELGWRATTARKRVMVPRRHFQVMRPSVSRRGGQSPRYTASTHVTKGRTGGIMVMLGPWCCLTSGHPPQGRPTPKLDRPQIFSLAVSSSSGKSGSSWCPRSQAGLPQVCPRRVGDRGFPSHWCSPLLSAPAHSLPLCDL